MFKKDYRFLWNKYVLRKKTPYEPEVRETLRRIKGDVFVDIGANKGLYSKLLSRQFKEVIAFEPNPNVLQTLSRKLPRNVKVCQIALSDRSGTIMLYLDPHMGDSGSADTILPVFKYNPAPPREGWRSGKAHLYTGKNGVQVRTETYDNMLSGRVTDLVKIDVEGAEFLVLDGMKDSLANHRIRRMMIELHDVDRHDELENILHGYGFLTRWSDPDHVFAALAVEM